jgi:GDSL-like lipase/acylhydrolase family protein
MRQSKRPLWWTLVILTIFFSSPSMRSVSPAQEPTSKTEEIEWTWEVRPAHVDASLPNVLLLGDSITRNYFPEVQRRLTGVANVYLMATSASVGDPRLPRQMEEFSGAEAVRFSVIHFNNGMHGWTYSEKEYREAFPAFVSEIRAIAPNAALVWATTTPARKNSDPGPTNARVDARNAIAESVVKPAAIVIDDQHGLMLQHSELFQDDVHFNKRGSALQGKQAAQLISEQLSRLQH